MGIGLAQGEWEQGRFSNAVVVGAEGFCEIDVFVYFFMATIKS